MVGCVVKEWEMKIEVKMRWRWNEDGIPKYHISNHWESHVDLKISDCRAVYTSYLSRYAMCKLWQVSNAPSPNIHCAIKGHSQPQIWQVLSIAPSLLYLSSLDQDIKERGLNGAKWVSILSLKGSPICPKLVTSTVGSSYLVWISTYVRNFFC